MLRRSLQASTSALSAFVLATGGLALTPASASAADATAPVVIDEVYGGGGNSGAPVRHDFVELHNVSASPVDLTGWSVQYASASGTSWTLTPLQGTLPAGTSYLVREAAGANTAAPAVVGDVDGTIAMSGTAGKVALVRSATALTCGGDCDGAADVVDFVGYGTAGDFLGGAPAPAPSNTRSVARTDHVNTAQNSADFAPVTPGPTSCGEPCAPPPPPPPADPVRATIAEIQGTGTASPLVGTRVVTEGVVTAAYPTGGLRGFYLQTAGTGGTTDAATRGASDGLFVFSTGDLPAGAAVGRSVRVTGTVAEFFGLTQVTTTAADVVELAEPLPAVTASTTTSWPATPAQRESLEGMLYRPTGDYTVTNTFSTGQFGEVGLAAGTTPLVQPTEVGRPGSREKAAAEADNAARAVSLDDGSTTDFLRDLAGTQLTPAYVSQTAPVVVGARVTFTQDVIVDFRNNAWKFQPTRTVVGPANAASPATFADPRTPAPDRARIGDAQLEVASFNVLNYFTTLGTDSPTCTAFRDRDGNGNTVSGGCAQRGAWDTEDFSRQQTKIVRAVNALDADVVGLLEIENSARLGEPADEALDSLVAALNAAAGGDVWAANPSSAELPPAAGQDVITNAIIYKPAAVARVGAARALGDQSGDGQAFSNAREPIGQVFTPRGGGDPFLFVVNHFKSKGSPGPWPGDVDAGDGQGSSNESRTRQATALRDWVPTVLPAGVKAVALVGDFNAYSQEDPLHVLYDAGYVDAEAAFGAKEWSYSFSGLSGSLDHVLLNDVARGRATGADIWNINSGEALALEYSRYNTSATDFHRPDPYRSSDHDPVVVGLRAESAPTPVQVLATNDFHGRLTANGAEAGAAVLAGAVDQLRAAQPNTVFAAAGDLIGASTFESFIAQDKPTLDALNEAGLEVSAVGNHEFDRGYDDLVDRVMAPYDATTNPYGGAAWQYLGANVRRTDGSAALPETWTRDFGGITVGFVGAVTEHLPELVSPTGIAGLRIEPVVAHADRSAAALKAKGADVVVLLVHEGAATPALSSAVDPTSDFGKIVTGVGPDVDAIVSGHTHLAYSHAVPVPAWEQQERAVTTRPVVSAGQYGTSLNQLLFTLDPETERVVGVSATVLPLVTTPGYPADAATAEIVRKAVAEATVLGAAKVGTATGPLTRAKLANGTTENRGGESTLGNLVAEVQRSATADAVTGGAQIAFMNPGGLRADLTSGTAFPADISYRQAANVQPFANTLVTMTLTGAQVRTALEQQWQPAGSQRPFLRLGISSGFTYTYDPTAAAGSRITGMQLNGTPVTPDARYSVTVNSFLAGGGDNFGVFAGGTDRRDSGQVDLQAMVDHLEAEGSVGPDLTQRSVGVDLPSDAPADYAPGATVSFALSSLSFSAPGDRKDTAVRVRLGGTPVGEFPVDSTIGSAVTDEYGTAQVRFAVPAGTPAGRATVTITGVQTGTTATLPLAVRHVVQVLAPTSGQAVRAGTPVPVSFRLTDAAGEPVADSVARALLSGDCAISVSLTGRQSVPATCPRYLADEQRFTATVLTRRGATGPAVLRLELRYPGLRPQVVETPVTLR